jgi:hypothetical protein
MRPSYSAENIEKFANTLRTLLATKDSELGEMPYLNSEKAKKVVQLLGGRLEIVPNWDEAKNGIGMIDPCSEAECDFIIRVPEGGNKHRNMFTIAHEIGHLFLHLGYNTEKWKEASVMFRDKTVNDATKKYYAAEWEANEFAGCYLMPKKEFLSQFNTCNRDVACVADKLYVSQAAVRVRVQTLERRSNTI